MITVITKKEDKLKSTNYKGIRIFKRKGLSYLFYILINKIKGYEIEVLKSE